MMSQKRAAGILLHPTSLPDPGGIGAIGRECLKFLDFLAASGFSCWQVLPLTPPALCNSPYAAYSAFAGNPLLIDLEQLVEEGDLPATALAGNFPDNRVDYEAVIVNKEKLLFEAADNFFKHADAQRMEAFWHFCDTTYWLHDYALFKAIKHYYRDIPWIRWPRGLAARNPVSCERASVELGPKIGAHKYQQWQFHRQWQRVRNHAAGLGISIIGDLPIFVAHDSADVWCNRNLFLLEPNGRPKFVAGVPPDYFSKTGQLWGNPLFDWESNAREGYAWWIARIRQYVNQFDMVRIDHFRGFESAWHVPANAKTAVKGSWVKGPGEEFFLAVRDAIGHLPFIAEDLGVITPEVEYLRDRFDLPGMKILQFAFDSDASNQYLPHNHIRNCVVYTGTHDNNTTRGWVESAASVVRERVTRYLGSSGLNISKDIARSALSSVADLAILPLQDILGLDGSARMNCPGVADGNWNWRFKGGDLTIDLASGIRSELELYGRCKSI